MRKREIKRSPCCLLFFVPTESTAKYVETRQSSTTIQFRWDDADNMKVVKSIVVNSYNAVSCTLRNYAPLRHSELEIRISI